MINHMINHMMNHMIKLIYPLWGVRYIFTYLFTKQYTKGTVRSFQAIHLCIKLRTSPNGLEVEGFGDVWNNVISGD